MTIGVAADEVMADNEEVMVVAEATSEDLEKCMTLNAVRAVQNVKCHSSQAAIDQSIAENAIIEKEMRT